MPRRQSLRGPAQVLIRSLIPLYENVTAIVKVLIKEGFGYRAEDMFSDVGIHLDMHRTSEAAKTFDFFSALPEELMIRAPFKADKNYRSIGLATFENTETGLRETRNISFYTDQNMTGYELEEEALEQFGKEEYEPNLVLVGYERQAQFKNTGRIWQQIKEVKPL